MGGRVLAADFFRRDMLTVARGLLGTVLVSRTGGAEVRVRVRETEAYHERERGAHTYGGRRTARTEVMFADGGVAYVYFVYGMHWQLNVVTGVAGTGEAVLLRAAIPLDDAGMRAVVAARRGWLAPGTGAVGGKVAPADVGRWLDGPGKLSQGLGVDKACNGAAFAAGGPLWFEEGEAVADGDVVVGPRIGIAYAGEDALLPWRFRVATPQKPSRTGSRSRATPVT